MTKRGDLMGIEMESIGFVRNEVKVIKSCNNFSLPTV